MIGSWCLELVSVVDWGDLRGLSDTSGAFLRLDVIPYGVILPCALLRVSVSVALTLRLAGARVKRDRFGEIAMCLFLYVGGYISFIRGSY